MTEMMTLDIESIAAGGNGVARKDGLVVFVPRTAPGDRVEAIVQAEKRFARGLLERVTSPSPARVTPACPHYDGDDCGGCQLQHLSLDGQQEAKRAIIRDSFARIGKRTIDLPPLHAGPSSWRYRHRLSLALRRGRDGAWRAGLHAYDDPSVVFNLDDCHISDERVVALWGDVFGASTDLPDVTELRGTVRLVGERGAFVLEGGADWPRAEQFAARLQNFTGIWWVPEGGRRRAIRTTATPDASFSQVNPAVAALMFAHVERLVVDARPEHVIDAYSGAGDLAAALQARGVRVTAVELDEEATAYAATRLDPPSRALVARVEDVLQSLLPADVIVVNPPRAGVDARVTNAIESATSARRLIYVSCDPGTLARDLARLPSWKIESVTAFDMFPQTAHVETVVELSRSAS